MSKSFVTSLIYNMCVDTSFQISWLITKSVSVGSYGNVVLSFDKRPSCLPKRLYCFAFQSAMGDCSRFPDACHKCTVSFFAFWSWATPRSVVLSGFSSHFPQRQTAHLCIHRFLRICVCVCVFFDEASVHSWLFLESLGLFF